MNENIEQILKMNLTAEQKEALLGQLANEIIKEQNTEKSWEKRNEETISKARNQVEEIKNRQQERARTRELEQKEAILAELTNANGEKIYSNLSDVSGFEIDDLYDTYSRLNPSKLEEAKKAYETKKIAEGKERLNGNTEKTTRDLTLEEATKLTEIYEKLKTGVLTEEEKISFKAIIDDFMTKTGIDKPDTLFEKANGMIKNSISIEDSPEKKKEFLSKSDPSLLTEEEKKYVRQSQGLDENAEISKENLSNIQAKIIEKSFDTKPEAPKKVSRIGQATKNLKDKINNKKSVALAVIAGVAITAAVVLSGGLAPVVGLGAAATGLVAYNEFSKGKKL